MGGSVWVKASLTSTVGNVGIAVSTAPGEPLMSELGRQLEANPYEENGTFSSTKTTENPRPSVSGYHLSLYEKSAIGSWSGPSKVIRSPASSRLPVYSPAILRAVP